MVDFAKHSSKKFNYDWAFNTFSVDISDLGATPFEQLDGGRYGFEIVSEKTGNVATYELVDTSYDDDNDITEWLFHPTVDTMRKFPDLVDSRVLVYND